MGAGGGGGGRGLLTGGIISDNLFLENNLFKNLENNLFKNQEDLN